MDVINACQTLACCVSGWMKAIRFDNQRCGCGGCVPHIVYVGGKASFDSSNESTVASVKSARANRSRVNTLIV